MKKMPFRIFVLVSAVKLFFLPLYRSTDFEVHRNWLAITHNLPTEKWYYEDTSEWTLDYPPLFAWMEYSLSHVAKWFDPKMLEISNLNYSSQNTIIFQRLSVIILDYMYYLGAESTASLIHQGKLLAYLLLISNPGLLMIDHIHFQYNGFLYGMLLCSTSHMIRSNYIMAAFWFAVLLNFKHIFLYIAPVYVVYMLRAYCFTVPSKDGIHTAWYSFSIFNLAQLGMTVVTVFLVSFGPFMSHLPQILLRLFPFKRGLCHAYWAPNFWALYNFADLILQKTLSMLGIPVAKSATSMTAGLVQDIEHAVLPTITPLVTLILTVVTTVPLLAKMWYLCADRKFRGVNFLRCIVVCASCSFLFGWHVHEKAILMMIIPLSFLAVLGEDDGRLFLILSTVGHYSLFPLLFPKNLLTIKLFLLLTHVALIFYHVPTFYMKNPKKRFSRGFLGLPMLYWFESLYIYGLIPLFLYENVFHQFLGLDKTLPFLPLMLTSVYCAIGVLYFCICYYYYFITFNLSLPSVSNVSEQAKKKT